MLGNGIRKMKGEEGKWTKGSIKQEDGKGVRKGGKQMGEVRKAAKWE